MKNTPKKSKAKIIKIKKNALKNMDERGFGAILEDINEKFSIMIEGSSMTNQKVDGLDQKVDTFKNEITETIKSNFKTVFGYLSRIDEEIQQIKLELENLKASKAEVSQMKIRVANLEYELAEVRRIAERRT